MKGSLLTAFLTVFITCTLFSQSYYRYQGKKVDLKTDGEMFIVQVEQLFAEAQLRVLDNQLQKGEIKLYKKLASNRFLVYGLKPQTRNDAYLSNVYRKDSTKMVIILPRIVIMLKQGNVIDAILGKYEGKLIIESGTNLKYVLKCMASQSDDVLKLVNELDEREEVDWCEPEFLCDFQTNNTLYPQQYYLKNTGQNGGTVGIDINVEPAWAITDGNACVTVAVIDVGVDRDHEDMGNRVLEGFTIRNPNGLGEPQNANIFDNKAHGMACAGIIAASNNIIGIRGIASNVNVLPVNIVPDAAFELNGQTIYGFGTNIEIAQAINWAWGRADVLSCSWGGGLPSNDITAAIDNARNFGRNGRGTVVVFSSGNDWPAATDVSYPGRLNGIITVGAINNQGVIWNYSQQGASMDLVAPSGGSPGDVRTIDRMGNLGENTGNSRDNFNGTSAACPQVAGVAALMLSVDPNLTEAQIRTILQQTATDMGTSGFDNTYGFGRVNAYAAVRAVCPIISGPSLVCTSGSTYTLNYLPSNYSVVWSCSSNLYKISSSEGTAIFKSVGSGPGQIWAILTSTTCGNVTIPAINVMASPGPISIDFDAPPGRFTVMIETVPDAASYKWYCDGVLNSSTTTTARFMRQPDNCEHVYYVDVIAVNTCESGLSHAEVSEPPCYYYSIFPNPASTEISITQNTLTTTSAQSIKKPIKEVRIIDKFGRQSLTQSFGDKVYETKLNISNLQTGSYTIQINQGTDMETYTIIKE